jgi:hypothetical protein
MQSCCCWCCECAVTCARALRKQLCCGLCRHSRRGGGEVSHVTDSCLNSLTHTASQPDPLLSNINNTLTTIHAPHKHKHKHFATSDLASLIWALLAPWHPTDARRPLHRCVAALGSATARPQGRQARTQRTVGLRPPWRAASRRARRQPASARRPRAPPATRCAARCARRRMRSPVRVRARPAAACQLLLL